jgi:hypothetical protein
VTPDQQAAIAADLDLCELSDAQLFGIDGQKSEVEAHRKIALAAKCTAGIADDVDVLAWSFPALQFDPLAVRLAQTEEVIYRALAAEAERRRPKEKPHGEATETPAPRADAA